MLLSDLKTEIEAVLNITVSRKDTDLWKRLSKIPAYTRELNEDQVTAFRACAALKRCKKDVNAINVIQLVKESKKDIRVLYPGVIRKDLQPILKETYTIEELKTFFVQFTGWVPSESWLQKSLRKIGVGYSKYGCYSNRYAFELINIAIVARNNQIENGRRNKLNLRKA